MLRSALHQKYLTHASTLQNVKTKLYENISQNFDRDVSKSYFSSLKLIYQVNFPQQSGDDLDPIDMIANLAKKDSLLMAENTTEEDAKNVFNYIAAYRSLNKTLLLKEKYNQLSSSDVVSPTIHDRKAQLLDELQRQLSMLDSKESVFETGAKVSERITKKTAQYITQEKSDNLAAYESAQLYINALRDHNYEKFFAFIEYVINKYKKYESNMPADSLNPLVMHELLKTDLNFDDVAHINFLLELNSEMNPASSLNKNDALDFCLALTRQSSTIALSFKNTNIDEHESKEDINSVARYRMFVERQIKMPANKMVNDEYKIIEKQLAAKPYVATPKQALDVKLHLIKTNQGIMSDEFANTLLTQVPFNKINEATSSLIPNSIKPDFQKFIVRKAIADIKYRIENTNWESIFSRKFITVNGRDKKVPANIFIIYHLCKAAENPEADVEKIYQKIEEAGAKASKSHAFFRSNQTQNFYDYLEQGYTQRLTRK